LSTFWNGDGEVRFAKAEAVNSVFKAMTTRTAVKCVYDGPENNYNRVRLFAG
jgi:hypothetical protein